MNAVEVSYRDSCAVIVLNRPEVLNAINEALLDQLEAALNEIEQRELKAVIITGAGRAFCSGTDISGDDRSGDDIAALSTEEYADRRVLRMHGLIRRLIDFPKVIVAALNGLAYGGGLELALACTFRTASPAAKLALPEIKLGLIPSYGGTLLLPRIVGAGRALEIMLTGESVDAGKALALGLVSSVGPDPVGEAVALAERLHSNGSDAQRAIRRLVAEGADHDLATGLELERKLTREVAVSDGAKKGLAKFAARKRQ